MKEYTGYEVKLTKIRSQHNLLRTEEVIGNCKTLPRKGERFVMTAEPLDPNASIRLVRTSPVKEIGYPLSDAHVVAFDTEFSTYRLEILKRID